MSDGRIARALSPSAKGWLSDALLYGASAVFAGATTALAGIPLQRSWGRVAVWAYGGAALVALGAAALQRDEEHLRRRRAMLLVAVFVSAAIVPLTIAAVRRAGDDPGDHAQSEVVVVEEAAAALLDGRDPYTVEYHGPLADRPLATEVHVPYLPGMFAFGVPRALAGHEAWADARVWFAIVALAVALPALRRTEASPETRLLAFQVLFALPTGALFLATGGDDVPVLALLLATTVLARGTHTTAAALLGGLALATKQTSLLVLPFLALSIGGRTDRRRFLLIAGGLAAAISLPFALWDLDAFVEDTVLFPLNLGQGESAAAAATVGSLLLDVFPSRQTAVTVGLVIVIAVAVTLLLFSGRITSTSQACARAAGAFVVAVTLAPAARAGYLVYPASLLAWALAFRSAENRAADRAAGAESAEAGSTRTDPEDDGR